MSILQTLFGSRIEKKISRASKNLSRGRYADVNYDLDGEADPRAIELREAARKALAQINVQEAKARFSSGP